MRGLLLGAAVDAVMSETARRSPGEANGWSPQPSNDAHHLRKAGAATARQISQAGGRYAHLLRYFDPAEIAPGAFRVDSIVDRLRVESQDPIGGNLGQARSLRLGQRMSGNKAFRGSPQPLKHLEYAVCFHVGSSTDARDRGGAHTGSGRTCRLATDLTRCLGPREGARLALCVEGDVEGAEVEFGDGRQALGAASSEARNPA